MAQGFAIPLPPRLFTVASAGSPSVPAVGWQIQTLNAGLNTNLTTYFDAGLTTPNTNPIITDTNGYFRMFVAAGVLVKVVVSDPNGVQQYVFDDLEPMITTPAAGSVTAVPTGSIIAFGASSAPTGFLLCDGSAVSRTVYAALFAVISTTFGSGDGSTTFNLPDLRQRVPLGLASSGTGSTLGGTGGAIDHAHTGPSHTHSVVVTRDGWGETLSIPASEGRLCTGAAAGAGQFSSAYQPTTDLTVTSAAGGTGVTGMANPPFVACTYIIKT